MNLSAKVWNITDQFKGELEMAIDVALGDGVSAAAMSRTVRKLLNNPTALFRRVRDKNGQLRLSQNAKNYHPGRGVYRSAYRNALRLTATETNMAYRTADHTRWQQLNFVTGIEIKLSANHNCRGIAKGQFYDICDELAGVYPKDFKFVGWHPFCRCFAVPKLADMDEFLEYQDKLVSGEDVSGYKFSGEVTQMPKQFNEWVKRNEERIKTAKSLPYFIKDNYVGGDISKGLVFAQRPLTTLERAEIRHSQRTQAQIDDIRRRNAERLKQYALIDKTANNILKVANDYAEVDVTTLKTLIAKRDMFAIKAETQKVAKEIVAVRKDEKALSSLIPNAHSLHHSYSMSELKGAYNEINGVMSKWLRKYNYSSLDNAPLEHLKNKLIFELSTPTINYAHKDIVKQALREKINLINQKIEWKELISRATALKSFNTKSSIYKGYLNSIDNAIKSNDFKVLQKSVAAAEAQRQKLISSQIKRGVDAKTALNKEYKGGAIGKDLTSQIDVMSMKSADPYGGTFTNNVARMQGFDAPAKLVSVEEFKMLEQANGEVFYRTVNPTTFRGKNMSSEEFASQLYTADLLELNGPGGRVYGDGMYVATSAWNGRSKIPLSQQSKQGAYNSSICYGDGSHTISEMTWIRKPKIIIQSDLLNKWNKLTPTQKKKFGGVQDEYANAYACALGYDAMYCRGVNYMVIWNRSIIAVKTR